MTERLRRNRHESGFTLIELMVVVLVLGILMAIAIPTFLGARNRSNDKQPQASLRIELTAAKILYTDVASYGAADADICVGAGNQLAAIEPAITCSRSTLAGLHNPLPATSNAKTASVYVASPSVVGMAAWSKSGSCFLLRTNETTGQVWYHKTSTAADCSGWFAATSATVLATTSW